MNSRLLAPALALVLAFAGTAARAGRSCEQKPPEARDVQRGLSLAANVARQLDASGAQVAVLARVGQNLSDYGQRYSHMGLVYREGTRWRVVHKLNHCGTAKASVYRHGLGEFFLDDLYEYEAGIVVLNADLQASLLPVLRDNQRLGAMNATGYNMVAYAWGQTYQQSNQWALETLALSQDTAITSRARAQSWLQLKGYEPATLHIPALKRLGARVTAANITFEDHPSAKRFSNRIETVTVDSVFRWLTRSGLGERPMVIR